MRKFDIDNAIVGDEVIARNGDRAQVMALIELKGYGRVAMMGLVCALPAPWFVGKDGFHLDASSVERLPPGPPRAEWPAPVIRPAHAFDIVGCAPKRTTMYAVMYPAPPDSPYGAAGTIYLSLEAAQSAVGSMGPTDSIVTPVELEY